MTKLLRLGCLLVVATLSSCQDGAGTAADEPAARTSTTGPTQALQLRTDAAGLVKTTNARGTSIQLHGQFESAVLAHREPDGSIRTECHDDQHAAEAFLHGGRPAAKLEVK